MLSENVEINDATNLLAEFCEKNPQLAVQTALNVLQQINNKTNGGAIYDSLSKQGNISSVKTQISIILPIYNEQENIQEIYQRLTETLKNIGEYEIIFVNDGSKDDSSEMILRLREIDKRLKLINFSRNFGHQAAVTAGIDYSSGEAVIIMDSDLQDPPEILPDIIRKWKEGADVVYAVRQKRKESAFKKTAYFSFYRLLQIVSNIEIPLDSGDFCLMDRKVVNQLKLLPERNRFVRGLRSWVGFKQVPFNYERETRFAGEVKYTFRKLVKLALSGIISFSSLPLHIATYLGFLTCLAGIIYILFVLAVYFITHESPQGWTSLVVLFLLVGGVQLTLIGVIGEYVSRMYDEVKQRPNYIVRDFFN